MMIISQRETILRAIAQSGWDYTTAALLPREEAQTLRDQTIEKYVTEDKYRLVDRWKSDELIIINRESWRWVPFFIKDECFLFFDRTYGEKFPDMYRFRDGDTATTIIAKLFLYHDEFYLTNRNADYVVAFDHENVFYTQGTAVEWLRTSLERIYALANMSPTPLYVKGIRFGKWGEDLIFGSCIERVKLAPKRRAKIPCLHSF